MRRKAPPGDASTAGPLRGESEALCVTCGVQGSGFRVWGLGFRVWGLGSRVQGSGFRV